jgi:hypothetical protein
MRMNVPIISARSCLTSAERIWKRLPSIVILRKTVMLVFTVL